MNTSAYLPHFKLKNPLPTSILPLLTSCVVKIPSTFPLNSFLGKVQNFLLEDDEIWNFGYWNAGEIDHTRIFCSEAIGNSDCSEVTLSHLLLLA